MDDQPRSGDPAKHAAERAAWMESLQRMLSQYVLERQAREAQALNIQLARDEWRDIRRRLGGLIVGREELLDMLSVLAIRQRYAIGPVAPRLLLTGPSGSGKTHTAAALAEVIGVPFHSILATEVVETGWSGGASLSEHLGMWYRAAGRAIATGVILLDEIDKIRVNWAHAHGNSIDKYRNQLASLLPLLGVGTPVAVSGAEAPIDFRRALVICGGAFTDADWSASGRTPTSEDLCRYGLLPELVDRLTERIALTPASPAELAAIYAGELSGALAGEVEVARDLGYELVVEPATYLFAARAVGASRGGSGPRVGAGWLAEAARRLIACALRDAVPPGILRLTPDDLRLPPIRSDRRSTW
jgi:ATP-dependent protease Clp ATPase subunit